MIRHHRSQTRYRQQHGFALIVGLILLVMMTVMAIAAFRLGANQTIVTGNAQHRNEGGDAAQIAIETVINSSAFKENPAAAIANSNCTGGGSNSLCVDVNGDGTPDFKVTLSPQPTCVSAAVIPTAKLDFNVAEDLACSAGTQQAFGVAGAIQTGNSLCANSNWEITAQAKDVATDTQVTVVQGVDVRISTTQMDNNCP